jgi:CHAT domain-containing protein
VDDVSTMLFMEMFYQGLADGLLPANALAAAQRWLRALSAADLVDRFTKERDHPYVGRILGRPEAVEQRLKFGAMPPTSRPFAHPYFWAPFMATGV